MRKYGKWLLVLGVLAANPAWTSADGFLSGFRSGSSVFQTAQKQQNQRKAEEVGHALKQAQLNGYDLEVEVRGDAVKLEGKVRDVAHRALAQQVCQRVAGINQVVNNLKYVPSGEIQQTSGEFVDTAVRSATYEIEDGGPLGIEQVRFQKPGKRTPKAQSPRPQQQTQQVIQRVPVVKTTEQSQETPEMAPPAIDFNMKSQAAVAEPAKLAPAPKSVVPEMPAQPVFFEVPATPAKTAAAPKATAAVPVTKAVTASPVVKPPAVFPAAQPTAAKPAAQATVAKPAAQPTVAPQLSNQEVAQDIANGLAQVGLVGYDVEIRYDNGIATLAGDVANERQRQAAEFAASRTEGVQEVQNLLQVKGPIAQTAFAAQNQQRAVHPASMTMPPAMMAAGMQSGGPTAMASAGNYSNPQLPSHAWPAYAQYPNSAAVSYPTQYSASAFPYIGPFYPYPQVPLGWREVGLEWDDGYWQLNFEKKKDAWYWLFAPKNWK